VKIVPQDPSLIPQYQTAGAACCDLVANIPPDDNGNRMIRVNHRAVARVDCGFVMEIPPGYKACVAARSGWASRGLIVTNGPGQIDSDYRDWVKVIVCNVGPENPIVIKHGDRIGQMWLEEVVQIEWEVTDKVSETDRKGGFGSTGGM
jgi:dUTP pyrophosphatase